LTGHGVSCVIGDIRTREDAMYDPPKARLEETEGYRDSTRRGFAVGWGALMLGIALAAGWSFLVFDPLGRGILAPFGGLEKLGWILAFGPVLWLGVHHHRRGHRGMALGVTLALGSLAGLIVLLLVWMMAAS
jgi:hypothetical protein